ncbi:MAG: pentapeptide repeat-containing protein, partial [Gammaproteobacteria bacterium]|nr:pentapeptide repeat-containing protein [Gammaproteobacteria bacterium]
MNSHSPLFPTKTVIHYANCIPPPNPGSDLRGSDLRGSDLRGSDLRGSDLRGSD